MRLLDCPSLLSVVDPLLYTQQFTQSKARSDGRAAHQVRKTVVKRGGLQSNCSGSAACEIGDTKVVAGVTLMVGQPSAANPNMGEFEITVSAGSTCNPLTSPYAGHNFAARGQDKTNPLLVDAALSESLIYKTVVETGMLDLRDLCIVEGQSAWNAVVEVVCLNHDGNLIDASLLATVAALSDTILPLVTPNRAGMIQHDAYQPSRKYMPLNSIPVSLTFSFLGESAFADPIGHEEISQRGSLTIVSCGSGKLISVSKRGGRAIASEVLAASIKLAIGRASQIHSLFYEHLNSIY